MNKPVTLHECDLVYLLNSKYHQCDHPCCCCGSPCSPWSDWIHYLQEEEERQASSFSCGEPSGPRGNQVSSRTMKKQNQDNTKRFMNKVSTETRNGSTLSITGEM
ncbi:hypothetical protein ILYODFUR_032219 [Ilyodon furcidens]|uniref:Uncharacterized protein n=1 Tax=Ilyodon furcidens TaxID=33524 RepID=A0ABV0TFR9_9TELE